MALRAASPPSPHGRCPSGPAREGAAGPGRAGPSPPRLTPRGEGGGERGGRPTAHLEVLLEADGQDLSHGGGAAAALRGRPGFW